jgi:hypothetical protein
MCHEGCGSGGRVRRGLTVPGRRRPEWPRVKRGLAPSLPWNGMNSVLQQHTSIGGRDLLLNQAASLSRSSVDGRHRVDEDRGLARGEMRAEMARSASASTERTTTSSYRGPRRSAGCRSIPGAHRGRRRPRQTGELLLNRGRREDRPLHNICL